MHSLARAQAERGGSQVGQFYQLSYASGQVSEGRLVLGLFIKANPYR